MENTYCVYIHTAPNGKMYIGQTSQKPEARWNNGRGYCRRIKGKYAQPLMARAVHKIPWEYWEHEVVYEGLTAEEANLYEEWLIYLGWSDNPEYGYNIRKGGSNSGLSEETKKKIGDANRGKVHSEEQNKRHSEIMRGRTLSEETKQKLRDASLGKAMSDEAKEKLSNYHKKQVIQYDLNGNLVKIWNSAKEAAQELGIHASKICLCCQGKRNKTGGYKWTYIEEEVSA